MFGRSLLQRAVGLAVVAGLVFAGTALAAGPASLNQEEPAEGGDVGTTAVGDIRWIVCNGHQSVGTDCEVRGSGVVSAERLGVGTYEVIFDINVRQCAYTATVGDFDAANTEKPGEITTVGRNSDVHGVFLTTHNSAGTFKNRSFHLHVQC